MLTSLLPHTPSPRSFLFATWDGGGHAGPALSIARGLAARGHEVRCLADPILRDEVLASGVEHVPWTAAPHTSSPEDWDRVSRTPAQAAGHLRDTMTCGGAAAYAADTRAELERRPADAVVADVLLPGAAIAAHAAGLPAALLSTTFLASPGWGIPPLGQGLAPGRRIAGRARDALLHRHVTRIWDKGLPALSAARAAHGLAPLRHTLDMLGEVERVLVLTSAALEFPEYAPPPHVLVTGPRVDDPAWAARWAPPPGTDPLVLVGLSSSFMDQAPALRRIAQALGRLPVRGVLTTGPAIDPGEIPAPGNVQVVRSAPHAEVLRHAAAVVTHGGHGTVAKALAHGVPLVCVPQGRDQSDVAARVVRTGAGVRLPKEAPAAQVQDAVRRVLGEPRFTERAAAVGRAIAAELAEDRAVAELEALATPARAAVAA